MSEAISKPAIKVAVVKTTAVKTAVTKASVAKPRPSRARPKPIVEPIAKPVAAKSPVAVSSKVAKIVPKTTAPTKAVPAKNTTKKVAKKYDKKPTKKDKPEKVKMERDSFTMPKDEYAQLTLLKARLNSMGQPAKKSELLRAGIKLLAAMSDNTLKTTLAKIPVIKTGRPKKKD
jgi:hypothetical protein